jgi:DNA-binding CsgD family transcriptional regulator
MEWARPRWGTQLRVWISATGLRANAELAAFARARRDAAAERRAINRAERLVTAARRAAADASAITPNADGWLAVAEAEYQRVCQIPLPELWAHAAETWERLERPPVVAYCRWRQAEALVAAGASRVDASRPLREAHDIAEPIGARPLSDEVERLAQRARLDLAAPPAPSPDEHANPEATLGLTVREAEVLDLVARGYTNREIAATLIISAKTASVHVSHILHKLGAPNRREAAAIAHRLAPPLGGRRQRDG